MTRKSLLLAGVAAIALFAADETQADCSVSSDTATCTGDPGAISYVDDSSVNAIVVEELTADISGDTGIELSQSDDDDEMSISATFGDYAISATTAGILLAVTGKTGSGGSAEGGDGSSGKSNGDQQLDFYGSTARSYIVESSGAGIEASGTAGEGGSGADDYAIGSGGDGGSGGSGAEINVFMNDNAAVKVTEGGIGFSLTSTGGKGGKGGEAYAEDTTGGKGGKGGDGGFITLFANAGTSDLSSSADNAHGVLVQSIAGAGGKGGDASGVDVSGGKGGQGGTGGDVAANVTAAITTSGAQALGIYALSFGGAGGDGGSASGVVADSGAAAGSGPGGRVTIAYTGTTNTSGAESNGIFAESVGGFSGTSGSDDGLFSWGASSSSAGDGGDVTVTVNSGSSITTSGDYAAAAEALSTGGGGGKGSSSSSVFTILGGDGSAGGDGGTIQVYVTGSSLTAGGTVSHALSAQSIGGGGGSSGSNASVTSVGGAGGSGGTGGEVTLTLDTVTLTANGSAAHGLFGQSVGGGGGNAVSSSAIENIGGSGGSGGSGGAVTAGTTDAPISLAVNTLTANANGVFLQSVGGGGGNGAASFALDSTSTSTTVGAIGGSGGAGGAVTFVADSASSIVTKGDMSRGLVVQSVGGGGGTSGNTVTVNAGLAFTSNVGGTGADGGSGKDGGTVIATMDGPVTTSGANATAIFAQSVGGGGGASGSTKSIVADLSFSESDDRTVGGNGGAGGDGGSVTVNASGAVSTSGHEADGIVAQSVGGGGGLAGSTTSVDDAASTVTWSSGTDHTVGGKAGNGGSGGTVALHSYAGVQTSGANSYGLLGQSIGGGGGKAGTTISVSSATWSEFNLTTGGSGGGGGTGGAVVVSGSGAIQTSGENAAGILAQSVGGSGGSGGAVIEASSAALDIGVTLGGNGGTGGGGLDVTASSSGSIATSGNNAPGILAQSLGGGGGNGGMSVTADVSVVGVDVTLGSTGGTGGTAGLVTVTNDGTITTQGTYGYGILAQSTGGIGGNAGLVVSTSLSAGEIAGDVAVTLGGDGGDGGTGGEVKITSNDAITTSGYSATGIIAQSIGGQGGIGAEVVSGTANFSSDDSLAVNVSVGGDGGDGGTASDVTVDNNGSITTSGHFSDAVFAQTVSGNGGAGGSSYLVLASFTAGNSTDAYFTVGGSGGDAGMTPGDVAVTNYGALSTSGGNSYGIYAQSIGGSGGDGGYGVGILSASGQTQDDGITGNISGAVGGTGGTGADAGTVTVNNYGAISTADDISRAIYAQSSGGGGGDGGSASQFSVGYVTTPKDTTSSSLTFSVTLGGSGGVAGKGGTVKVNNYQALKTEGVASYGIFAQSHGGGGGNAADGSIGMSAWLSYLDDAYEDIKDAQLVYSKLKNPASVFTSYSISIGGSGGASGDGGDVTVLNNGSITTTGADATGIYAHSIGGGGGTAGDGSTGLSTSLTVGGTGSGGGDGGSIQVTNESTITTTGARAMGIYAQSVGGAGGSGGDVEVSVFSAITELAFGSKVIGGGTAGSGGDGGDITVKTTGDITTSGIFGHGLWVQSVGGSGGASGRIEVDADGKTIGYVGAVGSAGDTGDGGKVEVTVDGAISVAGDYAVGVMAQTASGDESDTGSLTVGVGGSITAAGAYGRGILVQNSATAVDSVSGAAITVDSGATVATTSADAFETVGIMGGGAFATNTVTNYGTITSTYMSANALANDGVAPISVSNYGTFEGSVSLLDTALATFTNQSGGTFAMGTTVDIGTYSTSGTASTFANDGTMSPAGSGTIGATTLTAHTVTQSSSGTYAADLSMGSASDAASADLITLANPGSSNSPGVTLAGAIAPNAVGENLLTDGASGSVPIVAVASGYEGSTSFDGLTVNDTGAVDYTLTASSSGVTLGYTVDYSGIAALGTNAARFGEAMSSLVTIASTDFAAGSVERNAVQDLVNLVLNASSADNLEEIYEEHVVDEAGVSVGATTGAAIELFGLLQSCPRLAPEPAAAFYRQQDCTWSKAVGSYTRHDATGTNPGYDQRSYGMALGLQREIGDALFVEVAGRYDDVQVEGRNFDQDGYRAAIGAALKKEVNIFTFSGAVSGGVYNLDYDRRYRTIAGTSTANSDPTGRFLGTEARVTALLPLSRTENARFYTKPGFALALTQVWQDAFTETGQGSLNQRVDSVSKTSATAHPMLELGGAFDLEGHAAVAYLRGGATAYLTDPDTSITSRFANLGGNVPAMTTTLSQDRVVGEMSAGFNMDLDDDLSLSAQAQGALSQNSRTWGGYGKLTLRF